MDDGIMTERLNDRVAENLNLAYHAAMTTRWMWVDMVEDMEEAKAAAVAGLVYGDSKFDATQHPKGEDGWSHYVWLWARSFAQEAMSITRSAVTMRRDGAGVTPFNDTLTPPGLAEEGMVENVYEAGGYEPSFEDDVLEAIDHPKLVARIMVIVSALPEKQRTVFEYRHGLNGRPKLSQREIAPLVGVKKQNGASFHYMNALRTIRAELGVEAV
jgi:hypothetical protein